MEEYFYVIPEHILETVNDTKNIYQISVNHINSLVAFALTLEPLPEITEAAGYLAALDEYYSNNSNEFSECYKQIISSHEGRNFLNTITNLQLLKQNNPDLNENSDLAFNKYIEEYQKQVALNQDMINDLKETQTFHI